MAEDSIGKITNVVELALLCGIAYVGYKAYKSLFPDKEKPGGEPGTAANQDNPAKTATDLLGTPLSTGDMINAKGGNPLSSTIAVNTGTLLHEIAASPARPQLEFNLRNASPAFSLVGNLGNIYDNLFGVKAQIQRQADQVQKTRPSGSGGAGYGGSARTPLGPLALFKPGGTLTTTPQAQVLKTGPVFVPPNPFVQAPKYQPPPTVVYNNTIGQRITLDQVMPEDRQNQVGQKTPAQQMAAYGALEVKPVLPSVAALAAPQTTIAGYIKENPGGGISVSEGPSPGFRPVTMAELRKALGYG